MANARSVPSCLFAVTARCWAGLWLLAVAAVAPTAFAHGPVDASISVCFIPGEPCSSQVEAAIDGAQTEIRVQAYGFTSAPILAALVRARRRGVDVAVILDRSNQWQGYSGATFIAHADIPVWIDHPSGIAHSKVIVVDRRLVVGGSMNYTTAATARNAENVTFIDSSEVATWFLANWSARRAVSAAYAPRN
jgi:phosphatidylserine/phosphatidylglycerophosphate/cardiolipin synthase-like enzyme